MAIVSQFLRRPLPATRRAYSIFSKPGGGRYFNSTKPPTSTNSSKAKVESSTSNPNGEVTSSGSAGEDATSQPPASIKPEAKPMTTLQSLGVNFAPHPVHPPINPHDLKLHQFFSLHRPLLTVSQPVSSIFETSFNTAAWPPKAPMTSTHLGTIDDPPEASPESDADAARQLARALVANRVGASLSWEAALKRLGLDLTAEHEQEVCQAQAEFDMYMDSTKRKRRRKMKKHKCVFSSPMCSMYSSCLPRLKKRRRVGFRYSSQFRCH